MSRTSPGGRAPVPDQAPVSDQAPVPLPPGLGGSAEEGAVHRNRRRARTLAAAVGLAPGVAAGIVLVLAGLPVVAAVVLIGLTVSVAVWTWRTAPRLVVRAVGGERSDAAGHPRLHNLVDGLCASMGLPRPAIYVVDHEASNAMAVGRDPSTACLVVTSALDSSLTLVQLEGVLAHELVHVKRADTVPAAVAVVALAPWSLVVGTKRAAEQVHSLVGRGREFTADRLAAEVVRYPPGLGSALEAMTGTGAGGASCDGSRSSWPPGRGRIAALTRWLWVDPGAGGSLLPDRPAVGDLDDTRVRAESQRLL